MDDKNSQEDARYSQMMAMGARAGGRGTKNPPDVPPMHSSANNLHPDSQGPDMYSAQQQQHGRIVILHNNIGSSKKDEVYKLVI
jgi:hypothetical protein